MPDPVIDAFEILTIASICLDTQITLPIIFKPSSIILAPLTKASRTAVPLMIASSRESCLGFALVPEVHIDASLSKNIGYLNALPPLTLPNSSVFRATYSSSWQRLSALAPKKSFLSKSSPDTAERESTPKRLFCYPL